MTFSSFSFSFSSSYCVHFIWLRNASKKAFVQSLFFGITLLTDMCHFNIKLIKFKFPSMACGLKSNVSSSIIREHNINTQF